MDYEDPIVEVRDAFTDFIFCMRNSDLSELIRTLNAKIEQQGSLTLKEYCEILRFPTLGQLGKNVRFVYHGDEVFGVQCQWISSEEGVKAVGLITYKSGSLDYISLIQ